MSFCWRGVRLFEFLDLYRSNCLISVSKENGDFIGISNDIFYFKKYFYCYIRHIFVVSGLTSIIHIIIDDEWENYKEP